MDHTISENVYAGNAMNRRLFYQYGLLLPASPHGFVGQGLGQGRLGWRRRADRADPYRRRARSRSSRSTASSMVFQNTPNTEAPSEMNTYIPE